MTTQDKTERFKYVCMFLISMVKDSRKKGLNKIQLLYSQRKISEVQAIILNYCKEPKTTFQVASKINYSVTYAVNQVKILVAKGLMREYKPAKKVYYKTDARLFVISK